MVGKGGSVNLGAVIVVALGLLVAAAGCGGSTSTSEGAKTTVAGLSANDHGTKSVSGEAEMELDDYYLEPTLLRGKPGGSVKLELKNEGQVEHNLTIAAQGIDQDLESGEDATVTVTIPKSGVVAFYCKYHRSKGMAGGLESTNATGMKENGTGTTPTNTSTNSRYGY